MPLAFIVFEENKKRSALCADVYYEKNEAYKVFQLARHVRELAKKNITDSTYYVKDMEG